MSDNEDFDSFIKKENYRERLRDERREKDFEARQKLWDKQKTAQSILDAEKDERQDFIKRQQLSDERNAKAGLLQAKLSAAMQAKREKNEQAINSTQLQVAGSLEVEKEKAKREITQKIISVEADARMLYADQNFYKTKVEIDKNKEHFLKKEDHRDHQELTKEERDFYPKKLDFDTLQYAKERDIDLQKELILKKEDHKERIEVTKEERKFYPKKLDLDTLQYAKKKDIDLQKELALKKEDHKERLELIKEDHDFYPLKLKHDFEDKEKSTALEIKDYEQRKEIDRRENRAEHREKIEIIREKFKIKFMLNAQKHSHKKEFEILQTDEKIRFAYAMSRLKKEEGIMTDEEAFAFVQKCMNESMD